MIATASHPLPRTPMEGVGFWWVFPLLLATALCTSPVAGQDTGTPPVDTNYIQTFRYQARLNGGVRIRERSVEFSTLGERSFLLENRGLDFRLGGKYGSLGYTFSIPISDLGTSELDDEASSLGLALRFYRPTFYVLADVRNTKGFRLQRPSAEDDFREDVSYFNATFFGFHVLRHDQFSLRSAFKQRGRQVRSSGSLLIGGLVSRQVLSADSIRIPLTADGEINVVKFRQHKVGAGLGYAYTYNITRYWYVTPMVFSGPEFRFVDYDAVRAGREREDLRVNFRVRGHLAFGYNGVRNFAVVTARYLPSRDPSENLDTRVGNAQLELRVGRRLGRRTEYWRDLDYD